MTSAIRTTSITSTHEHKIFHWGNLYRTKTPKALVVHLVNEMTEFFKRSTNPILVVPQKFTKR